MFGHWGPTWTFVRRWKISNLKISLISYLNDLKNQFLTMFSGNMWMKWASHIVKRLKYCIHVFNTVYIVHLLFFVATVCQVVRLPMTRRQRKRVLDICSICYGVSAYETVDWMIDLRSESIMLEKRIGLTEDSGLFLSFLV